MKLYLQWKGYASTFAAVTCHYHCYCHVKRAEGVSVDTIKRHLFRLAGHLQDTLHQPLILSPRDVCEYIALWQTTIWLTDIYRDQTTDSSRNQPVLHCLSCRANSCYWTRGTSVLIQLIESGKMRWIEAWGMYGGGKKCTLSFCEETGGNETPPKT